MATKDHKKLARGLIEGLENRIHCGPPVCATEIESVHDFLHRHEFSPDSDYFSRLAHLRDLLRVRPVQPVQPQAKRNYGGEAGGCQMQVQSVYDHVILSTCYQGDFNGRHGRIKLSHRFNQEGRIDFLELKYLTSLHPPLNGEMRKLLMVRGYQSIRKDWYEADAAVLRVLPQELVFLFEDIFRCERAEVFAWLVNIGHGMVDDLLKDLKSRPARNPVQRVCAPEPIGANLVSAGGRVGYDGPDAWGSGRGSAAAVEEEPPQTSRTGQEQLRLEGLLQDRVASPILEKAALLESVVEMAGPAEVGVRYLRRNLLAA